MAAVMTIAEMSETIDQAMSEIDRLRKNEEKLQTVIALSRATLDDSVMPLERRVETALRFLRTGELYP